LFYSIEISHVDFSQRLSRTGSECQFPRQVTSRGRPTSTNNNVKLVINTSPSGATLAGTRKVAATNGVATFSDISFSKAGAYTLSAADGSLAGATSAGFSVGQLVITQQPANAIAGAAIPIVVDVEKPSGKTIGADDSEVTLTIKKGPAGAMFTGTSTVAAVKGVATFSDLSLTEAGTYKPTITDGEMSAKTVKFTVSAAAPADLAFVQGPTPVKAGRSIAPAISVSLTDAFGNPITGTKVKMAIASGPAGAILSGTLKVAAENGLATFGDISLTESGGYTLKATHGSLTPATSSDFTVSAAAAAQLAFIQQPSTAAVGSAVTPAIVVDVEDSFGNLVATNDSNVTLLIKPGTGPAGAILDGTLTVAAQNGVAMFSDISLNDAGAYKLKAADGDLAKARSVSFNILAAS
jgi:hypothetical protein